jgi:hypothetical protein
MNVNMELRRFAAQALASAEKIIRGTAYESLAVAQVEPPGWEVSRAGYRFWGGPGSTSTGRAPTATIPTTAAQWLLWNGESPGGAAYAIETISIAQLSGTAAVGGAILAALTTTTIAAPTAATGYATSSISRSTRGTKAVWADAQTLANAPNWVVLKANGNPATTTNGGDTVDVGGRIVVPPGYGLALHYLSGAGTTPLFLASAIWAELPSAALE